jgi:hypothetical protein
MRKFVQAGKAITSIAALASFTACSNLPGNNQQQGAVIGGASGAAVGAAVTHNHALGAIIGGAVGAAGGYVVGANKDKIFGKDNSSAAEAERKSQEAPATPQQALSAATADINNDGFVTLDEVVALRQAGVTDEQMIQKLRATNQVFNLNDEQKRYLLDRGVSQSVIDQMATLNQTPVPSVNSTGPTASPAPPPNAVIGTPQ